MRQEKNYDILRLKSGELVIAISEKPGEPEKPFIIHDGSEHAIFYRKKDDVILLDFIHRDILSEFAKSIKIIVAEVDRESENILKEYLVPIKRVKKYAFQQIKILNNKYKK